MLQVISALKGFAIEATDGRIGTVVDFLFDDTSWKVRWLVVDCGNWLEGRKVLIHPSAVSYAGLEDEQFEVKLTKAQVEGSPDWQEHQPVSQQMQNRLYDYYGWDPAWGSSYFGVGAIATPFSLPPLVGGVPPDEAAARIAPIPLLVVHGDQDIYFPPDHAHQLYEAAGEPKELWIVPGFGHAETGMNAALLNRIGQWVLEKSAATVQPGEASAAPATR